jgi:starch-binding outer membrane protein, SusD/RagB family
MKDLDQFGVFRKYEDCSNPVLNGTGRMLIGWIRRSVLIIWLFALCFSSCNDYLEILPLDGLVGDEYWKKKEDVSAVLMGAYQKFAQLNNDLFLYGEIRGDMLEIFRAPENQQQIIFGNLLPDNVLCEWGKFYEVINYCNFVYEYAPIVYEIDNTFSEFEMRSFQAEAVFLRSLAYFYLVRIFKDVPIITYPTDNDAVDFFPAKSADTTVLRVIKEDLKSIVGFVKEDYGNIENNKGRANRGAINALIADISLWNFEYDECIEYCEKVENDLYELLLPGDYFNNFYPGNSLESIFEFQFNQTLGQNSGLNTLFNRNNGHYRASDYSIELMGEDAAEVIRGFSSIAIVGESDYIIWKYQGSKADGQTSLGGSDNNSQNWIVYRLADVLLMKAEALSQRPDPNYVEAGKIINDIRARALQNSIAIPETPIAFENVILEERAKELAYEGKRWFDLMRMGRRNNYQRKDNLIKIIIEDVSSAQKLVLASKLTDPYGWYFPIHFNEIEANGNLDQNPFYEVYTQGKY